MNTVPKLVLFDLDGTIYVSGNLITGVKDLLQRLTDLSVSFGFMTNNSSVNPDDYFTKLSKMGLPVTPKNIVTSCEATVRMLNELNIERDLFIVGTERFKNYLAQNNYFHNETNPNAVLIGFDLELTFEKLTKAVRFLENGVPLVASHPDVCCPSSAGPIPDAGMILAALKAGSNVSPLAIAGKPYKWILDVAKEKFKITNNNEIFIAGDRLATDIMMGNKFGIKCALVLTGVSKLADVDASEHKPDYVLNSIPELLDTNLFKSL
ncbi:MAG: hypothetical protein A2Y12_15650 [Planctomycetes bacterium GWF2_42_9]|nr:MAG: hypothetical protein A2Y12_15650 [Planctomycetes bacterium GWF2_42_9]HAL45083.1 HAD family hydrolase [Phycisphaerales bacterium]